MFNDRLEGLESEQLPGTCTINVLHNFPDDAKVDDAIADRAKDLQADDEDRTKRQAKRDAEQELDDSFGYAIADAEDDSNGDTQVHLATVSQEQSYALDALKERGFDVVGTYQGNDGTVTVLSKGLNLKKW